MPQKLQTAHKDPSSNEIKERKCYVDLGLTLYEYEAIISHLGRLPNWTELGIYSVMWSEHCSYKNSKPLLQMFPTEGPHVIQGPGEGAGVIDIGDNQAVVFKMESHNHPSFVEPFQGAATGVGGIIRDIFSMGARPIALLNSLRFGRSESKHVPYLLKEVVAGISHYGNCMGIPTVGGEVFFDPSYEGNPLVNVMCVGILSQEDIQKGIAKGIGNAIMYIGASTGRDGIHGATFASEEFNATKEDKRPCVQVGDPFMEKLLLEACMEMVDQKKLIGIQDMGAAGLTCSSAEMAAKGKVGIELNLDLVPQREEGMSPYEILLSESQERMLLVVEPEKKSDIEKICNKWDVPCAVVGKVTEGDRYRVFHQGSWVVDVPVQSLVDLAPVYVREESFKKKKRGNVDKKWMNIDPQEAFLRLLSSANLSSKEWVYRQYDYMVKASTRVPPGKDAGVIFLRETNKGLAMTVDGNSRYVFLDPEVGGRIAVCEAARNLVCSGAKPIGATNCLNFGNPKKPEIYHQLKQAIKGMSEACGVLKTPIVGGNVSLYNETRGSAINPTPIVGMVGLIKNPSHITTSEFKSVGDAIFLLGETFEELEGSELQSMLIGEIEGEPPHIDLWREERLQKLLLHCIEHGLVHSAHDLSEGGLMHSLTESCIGGGLGAKVEVETLLSPIAYLFSESQSRVLVSTSDLRGDEVKKLAHAYQTTCTFLGYVQEELLHVSVNHHLCITNPVKELSTLYREAMECSMNPSSTD